VEPQEIIRHVYGLPQEERYSFMSRNPDIMKTIQGFLEQTSEYNGLPENEKVVAKQNLGFPSVSPEETMVAKPAINPVSLPNLAETEQRHAQELAARPRMGTTALVGPAVDLYYNYYKNLINENIRPAFNLPPESVLETPFGNLPVGKTPQFARGVFRGLPGGGAIVSPGEKPQLAPDFFSAENAGMMATDILITLPIFQLKALQAGAQIPQAATALFQYFVRYPAIARAVTNASLQGGAIAAYQTFSHRLADSIQKGHISVDGLATEFGGEFAKISGVLLGFHGFHQIGKAGWDALHPISKRAMIKSINESTGPMGRQTRYQLEESIAQDIGEATTVGYIRPPVSLIPATSGREFGKPPVVTPPTTPFSPPEPPPPPAFGTLTTEPASETTELLTAGQRAISREVNPVLQAAANAPNQPPIPGFLQSAEQILNRYPRAKATVDNVLGPMNITIAPGGAVSAIVPETAVKASFIEEADSIVGDLVYASGKVVKVLEKFPTGIRVGPMEGSGSYFVPFAKVTGKLESKFGIGEEVFKSNGEKVVVEGIINNNTVRVIDSKGTKYAIPINKLTTQAEQLSVDETAERIANGLDTPAPSGGSVWELLKDEGGFWYPFGGGRTRVPPANRIDVQLTTQPDGKDFGGYRYVFDAAITYGMKNKKEYDVAAKLIFDAKTTAAVSEYESQQMVRGFRKLVGASEETSQKLTRALVGVPSKTDKYTKQEVAVISDIQQWSKKEVIPLVNKHRASIGEPPVPPDYNYVLNLVPEIVLSAGKQGHGFASMIGGMIKTNGVNNLVNIPFGTNPVKLEVNANVWEVLDGLSKYVTKEKSWRNYLAYGEILKNAETSPSNKKFIQWHLDSVSGKQISPDMADFSHTASKIDNIIAKSFPSSTAKFVTSTGQEIVIQVPKVSIADKSLNSFVTSTKRMNYAAMIGANLRTMLLNTTQPITDGLARIPASPIAAGFDLMLGYAKGMGTLTEVLFSPKALKHYRDLGVVHDMEELFTPNLTRVNAGNWKAALYGMEWLYDKVYSASFLGMRAAEILNRVTVYEAHQQAIRRAAKNFNPATLNDPDFVVALKRASTYTTNITNFLYGEGFRSPVHTGVVGGLTRGGIVGRIASPLGEAVMQFNTFSIKHMGAMGLLLRQGPKVGDHINFAHRMAAQGAPQEFGKFIEALHPQERYAFLKALVYQQSIASFLAGATGLTSLAYQLSPPGLIGLNPYTPLLQSYVTMLKDLTQLDYQSMAKNLAKNYLPGMNAVQRWGRGMTPLQSTLATKRDIQSPEAGFDFDSLVFGWGEPGGTKSR